MQILNKSFTSPYNYFKDIAFAFVLYRTLATS